MDCNDAEEKKYHVQQYRDALFVIFEELLGRGTRCLFKAGVHFVIGAIQERIIRVTWFTLFDGFFLIG